MNGKPSVLELRENLLELILIDEEPRLTLKGVHITTILTRKEPKVLISTNCGPLDKTKPTTVTLVVINSSTTLTDVGMKVRFRLDVAHDS